MIDGNAPVYLVIVLEAENMGNCEETVKEIMVGNFQHWKKKLVTSQAEIVQKE